ncbi:Glyoxalase-like domain-containing protein [Cohaesibacter sp. ES.047]|uniref:VOC family protein n=1 Tax=Cohaesibacter sp. ES.047 TaxID=1798205 RepID=UPI000BBF6A8C|nr:VOC family protein [Cohaesibacter sp. ES.047]SNY93672.1 Glyoxalase-like domain-containing protein [Cohaesibacter sp. ES.047]
MRGVDHIVLAVQDLDAARDFYSSLGFTITPTAYHPFGTKNALIQFNGSFLELLAVDDEGKIPAPDAGKFSFGGFNRDFLKKREGASMLVLRSRDVAADLDDFAALGLQTYPQFDFEREATLPDGSRAKLRFSNGYLSHRLMAHTGFFVCDHRHDPAFFWHNAYQTHKNGASGLASVLFAAANPSDHHEFLGGFCGQRVMRSTSAGVEMDTVDEQLEILTPAALSAFYGIDLPSDMPDEGGIAALSIRVDADKAKECLVKAGIAYRQLNGYLVVKAGDAFGCALLLKTD